MFCRTLVCPTWGGTHATGQNTCLRQFLRCHFLIRLIYQQITIRNVNRALIRTERPFFVSDGAKNIGHIAGFIVYFSANSPKLIVFSPEYFFVVLFWPSSFWLLPF